MIVPSHWWLSETFLTHRTSQKVISCVMEATLTNHKHIFVHAHAFAWGHHKPLVAFVSRILESRPEAIVTYFATTPVFSNIQNELARLGSAKYEIIKSRLNVIDISGPITDIQAPPQGFVPGYVALYKSEAVTCLSTGETISGLSPPTLAIIDPFCLYAVETVREVSKEVPILSWWTAPAGAGLRLLGPQSLGGISDPSLETPEGRAAMKAKILAGERIEYWTISLARLLSSTMNGALSRPCFRS
ncbi:glycosyltransferase family 1 protein [Collybiopsis luxurians FD-317 M1]|uniref:Glycosyltransferase family 1 protein n=1 Tax=Collybiopsis luxurians FD-317 M1 TaxID=944289 RepID=A0A0D0BDI7_9AGAR|nr:glycosyltransferase family 1 protein [Collybiopsis luxurians FD-317 M1]